MKDDRIRNYKQNKALSKRVKVFIVVGAIVVTSAAVAVVKPWKTNEIPNNTAIVQELTHNLTYTVKFGESLWSIARKYVTEKEVDNEVIRIAAENSVDPYAPLRPGTELQLNIPRNNLQDFLGDKFTVEFIPVDEWDAKDYFVWQTFASQLSDGVFESKYQEERVMFENDYEFYMNRLRDIARLKYNYEEMLNEPYFYNEEAIQKAKANITYLYNEIIEDLRNNLFTSKFKYGVDFILPDQVLIIPAPSMELTPEAIGREAYADKPVHAYAYQVKEGDSLWSIAAMYCNNTNEIPSEIESISLLNEINPDAILPIGKILTLNIPHEHIQEIIGSDYTVEFTQPDEMEAYAYFIQKVLTFTDDADFKGEIAFNLGTAGVLKSQYDNVFGQEADVLEAEILQIYQSIIEDLGNHPQTSRFIFGYDFISPRIITISPIEIPSLKK